MIFTDQLSSVHAVSGMGTRLVLAAARDRRGKRVYLDVARWMDKGRNILKAYKADGSPLWVRGRAWQEAQVYHRDNIASCEVPT